MKLKPKVGKIIMGLGVGEHFEHWGFDMSTIVERDWHETVTLDSGFTVHTTPGRHFSGRGLKRNQSLWMSYVLQTPSVKIFLGGDSGYDTHFEAIGKQHGPFDFVLLECGQYHPYWKYIHMMPEEVVQAAIDLKAKTLMPVHWSKFSLALHAWDEPIKRALAEGKKKNVPMVTPMIGQIVNLHGSNQHHPWWEAIK
jgi:L-ascorbate metabolism protein UlaG (beta-lactamase superfamily)